MEPEKFIKTATSYLEQGFSVIPVGVDKKPLIKWEQYQKRRATSEEVEGWVEQFKSPNVAIITGSISGIVVIDVEAGGSTKGLTPTVISKTGGGGWHFYYKYPGYEFKNSARKLRELTDIRGDGGYVIAPPSMHKSGKRYEWSVAPGTADLDDIPDWILQSLAPTKTESHEANDWEKLLAQDNDKGTRNDMAAKVAGYLLTTVNQTYWDSTGWSSLDAWNQAHNKPPLPNQELRRVWDSIKSRASKSPKPSIEEIMPDVHPMWYSELAKLDIPAPTWIVDKFIPDESISIISAPPAQYKTWLAYDIAIQVALGKPLFGQFETKQTNVLIVDEESGLPRIRERLEKFGVAEATPIAVASYNNFKLDEANANSLIAYCNAHAIGLVVFDSLTRIHNGDENLAKDMSVVMGDLKRLAQKGIAVLLIHHNRKPGQFTRGGANEMRGSGDILAACDVQISLQRKAGTNVITITQNKNRDAADLAPFDLEINSDESGFRFEYLGSAPKQKSKDEKIDEAAIAYIEDHGLSALPDIQSALNGVGGKTKIANRLDVLTANGKLTLTIAAHGSKFFDLPQERTDE